MPLKTFVKVGSITNLSDARYCAGMGVDMLGFSIHKDSPTFVPPKLFQEIRGWVSGPKVVAELYGCNDSMSIETITENYAPDFLELSFTEYQKYHTLPLPFLVYLNGSQLDHVINSYNNIAYWLIDQEYTDVIRSKTSAIPILLKVTSKQNLEQNLRFPTIKGVALNGSPEIRPGYKNYDELADVLEELEEL